MYYYFQIPTFEFPDLNRDLKGRIEKFIENPKDEAFEDLYNTVIEYIGDNNINENLKYFFKINTLIIKTKYLKFPLKDL